MIGATAGVDPATGELAGPDIASQTVQILDAFEVMLASVGSDLDHVLVLFRCVSMKDLFDRSGYYDRSVRWRIWSTLGTNFNAHGCKH